MLSTFQQQLLGISNELELELPQKHYSSIDISEYILEKCNNDKLLPDATIKASANTGSIYINFNVSFKTTKKFGQLRIADHEGYEHLGYRWNLRSDKEKSVTENSYNDYGKFSHIRYIFSFGDVDIMLDAMKTFLQEIG